LGKREKPKEELKGEEIRLPCVASLRYKMAVKKGSSQFGVRCIAVIMKPPS
jgi:hypothetical protein